MAASSPASQATNFVPTVIGAQIYVHNRQTTQIEIISRDNSVAINAGNGASSSPVISADGRFVAFVSSATNLVTGVSGQQVYLRDRQLGQTTLISLSSGGVTSNGLVNSAPVISSDGQFIALVSNATNLIPGVSGQQIYLRDHIAGTTNLISQDNSPSPVAGNASSDRPSISSNGQFIAFSSLATNLGVLTGPQQIYVHDRLASANGVTSLVSQDVTATSGNGASSTPSINGDGRFVAFTSLATNFVIGASGQQIYLHDRNTGVNGTNRLISHDNSGVPVEGNGASSSPSISSNGQIIAFTSPSTNLLPSVTGQQIYSFDRLNGPNGMVSLVSKDNGAVPAAGSGPSGAASVNSDGSFIAFSSQATNLVSTPPSAAQDIYIRALP
jgi:Tol biopolymer transport system component